MIRYLLIAALLFYPSTLNADIVSCQAIKYSLSTKKIAYIQGEVGKRLYAAFIQDMDATAELKGDRLIIINSQGGRVDYGKKIIDRINTEKAAGVKVVCIVLNEAHSMAFNILTHCNIRLSQPNALMLVHKARLPIDKNEYLTSEMLRQHADELDKDDEPFRQANSKAMGLSLKEYDEYTSKEVMWRAETLLKRGYLHCITKLKKVIDKSRR